MKFLSTTALVLLFASLAAAPTQALTTIDFETPNLGAFDRMVIDPYVASGVTFNAIPAANGDVGLVKNSATTACVEPQDANQKLGTTPISSDLVGLSAFSIRADFPVGGDLVTIVSVEFQALGDGTAHVRLFNAANVEVGSKSEAMDPDDGTCGFPGGPRARTTVTAMATEAVAYATMEVTPDQHVFVLDDFSFGNGTVQTDPTTWGRVKSHYR